MNKVFQGIQLLFAGGRIGAALVWPVSAIVSWFSTAAFKTAGWAGVGKAMLVGSGATMGAGLLGLAGIATGGIAGGIVGAIVAPRDRLAGAMAGGTIGLAVIGIPAGFFGATEGYSLSRQWLSAAQPQPVPAVRTLDAPVATVPAATVTVQRPAA